MTTLPDPRPTRSQTMQMILALTLAFTSSLAFVAPAAAADAPAQQALTEFYGKKVEKNQVQNRFFIKTNRFELAPAIGYVPNNAFVSNYYGGAFVAYHFSETFSAEGAFVYAPNSGDSGVKNLTKTLVAIAYESNQETTFKQPLDRLQIGAIFSARFAPIYGKINLLGEGVLNFDVYGTAGVGLLVITKDYASVSPEYKSGASDNPVLLESSPSSEANPAINLGIGFDFFLTQSLALKIDARSEIYFAKEPDYGNKKANGDPEDLNSRVYNTFLTTAGISIFIPKMKPRMFNF